MSTELKPCPMCGCAATFVKHSAGVPGTQGFDKWDAVACKHCRATVGACDRRFRCRADAAEAWNRRAPQAAPELSTASRPEAVTGDAEEIKRLCRLYLDGKEGDYNERAILTTIFSKASALAARAAPGLALTEAQAGDIWRRPENYMRPLNYALAIQAAHGIVALPVKGGE